MQGGLHPDLKIDLHETMLRGIKERFKIHLHCYSASEIIAIAEYSGLSIRDTISRLRDAGLDSIPGGGAEILDDEVRHRIARLKCLTEDWLNVHRTAHQLGMRTTATMMSVPSCSKKTSSAPPALPTAPPKRSFAASSATPASVPPRETRSTGSTSSISGARRRSTLERTIAPTIGGPVAHSSLVLA